VFEWFYVYGVVAPTSGEHFFLELPALNAENFQIFVDTFAKSYADSLNILLVDKSGAHTAKKLRIPENVRLVFLPPYCPELNPIERFWRDLRVHSILEGTNQVMRMIVGRDLLRQ